MNKGLGSEKKHEETIGLIGYIERVVVLGFCYGTFSPIRLFCTPALFP